MVILPSPLSLLREACLQMRNKKLSGNNDVVKDNKVTAETVGGAELCQGQMHLVHTMRRGRKTEQGEGRMQVIRRNVLTMNVVWMFFSQTNRVINMLKSHKTHLQTEAEGRKTERRERDRTTILN